MIMHRAALVTLVVASLLAPQLLTAVQITVQWPSEAGTYSLNGATKQSSNQSGTYEVGEGQKASLAGRGFNVGFTVRNGKIELPFDFAISNTGVRFDPKTDTFSFAAFDVRVKAKDFSGGLGIDSTPVNVSGPASQSFKFIAGRHTLIYGKNRIGFDLDGDGYITLLDDIQGITSRGSIITLLGTPGREIQSAADPQQEKADQALHDRILAASEKAAWKKDFTLVEKMGLWDFSEQQVSYPLELPAEVKPDSLKLLAFTNTTVRIIPFQLSNADATISFRTALPKGATRLFRLVSQFDAGDISESGPKPPTLQATSNPKEALLGNGLLFLKVPAGRQDFAGGKPLAQVPAPILGAAREAQPQAWMAGESFAAPDSLLVDTIEGKLVESGPSFVLYQITYRLQGAKTYTTNLELRAGESHVAIAEQVDGFTPEDRAFLHLDYGKGMLNPDRRMVASLGGTDHGYARYSGAYDRNVSTDDRFRPWPLSARWLDYDPKLDDSKVPRLDFRLGLFLPNCLGVMHAAAFYQEYGNDALLLAINRPEEWKTYVRALWTDYRSVDNLRFYSQNGRKYMATALAGQKRFWVLGLIPRSDVVMRAMDKVPAGPEVWLSTELGAWNLQAQKDRMSDWEEKLDTPIPPDSATTNQTPPPAAPVLSYDDYVKKYVDAYALRDFVNFLPFFGGLNGRSFPVYYSDYIRSRASWTPEQRERIRQILVYLTDYNDGDDNQPSHGMLSGHPNFLMDAKQNVALGLATFPNHPKAKAWRDSFLGYFDELLDKYERKDVPELNTRGGRWTENIACYWGQSMVGILNSELALKSYDGTTLARNPRIFELIRWMRDALMSPQDGQRLVPPQGAHALGFIPGGVYWKSLFQLSDELASGDPHLAKDMRWIESQGKEGTKPDVRSVLYTDYGPIFHYDFGGEHESYAHLQNINGMSYRWGHDGIVYYGAKNKIWSYNGPEANGDAFDWEQLTALTVNGNGLAVGPTDQLLYDFDFAQFYRQPGKEGDDYRARALMLLRDDYLVVSDEMKSRGVSGIFRWVNLYDMPEIYQLKPGAKMEESTFDGAIHHRPDEAPQIFKRRAYSGQGDFLTIVAPTQVTATATPFGATVNGEYVFASQKPEEITQGTATFYGTYGYARTNQLALFQGTEIGLDGFTLRREGGDFGVSAAAESNKITGRIVGRSGGKISIVAPAGFDATKAGVMLNGRPIPHTVEQGAIVFAVEIAQRDGLKGYEITFGK